MTPHKRYGFKTDEQGFSREKLRRIVSGLNPNFTFIDIAGCHNSFDRVSRTFWARDWISQFDGYEDYRKRGMGIALEFRSIPQKTSEIRGWGKCAQLH